MLASIPEHFQPPWVSVSGSIPSQRTKLRFLGRFIAFLEGIVVCCLWLGFTRFGSPRVKIPNFSGEVILQLSTVVNAHTVQGSRSFYDGSTNMR